MTRAGALCGLLGVLALGAPAPAGARGKPDLVVTSVKTTQLVAGAGATVSDTTRNAGGVKAKASTTEYLLSLDRRRSRDDLRLGRRPVKALRARRAAAGKASVRLAADVAPGAAFVLACADAARKVRERNERNNCRASARVTVASPVFVPTTPPALPGGGAPPAGATPTPTPTPTPPTVPGPTVTPTPTPSPCADCDPFPQPPLQPAAEPAAAAPPAAGGHATSVAEASRFLYTGADPIQKEVEDGMIEARRVAVLRGAVRRPDGSPIAGARVTVLGRPEFGYTATRTDGGYELAVNGGEVLVVHVEQQGFPSVQRHVDVPWQDYVGVEKIVMKPYDAAVTAIEADSTADIQVARGSAISDADGTRRAMLMFEKGTEAVMELPDGSVQPLEDLHVRATEYTVGASGLEAMPGELPATSAYTYAVELSVDEAVQARATDVRFDKPVVNYVDNFLGFPAGTSVPTAYYDRERGVWVPSENGLVIAVLSEAGGMANVNADSDPEAESDQELAALGIDQAERAKLAQEYEAPKSLWRVEVTHFTPWDHNWPYGCDGDCPAPEVEPPPPPPDDDCQGGGSMISYLKQVLGERVGVVGTPLHLHYSSDRMPGYREAYTLRIPLTGASPPAGLQRIELVVGVAGQTVRRSFDAPTANLSHTFTWDGKDGYGRAVQGASLARVRIGYVYPAVYLPPARLGASFAQFGDTEVTLDRTRFGLTVWQEWTRPIGTLAAGSDALGGWSLDVHHAYDPTDRTLYMGEGTRRRAEAVRSELRTVAGIDPEGPGEITPARMTVLELVRGIDLGPDGSLYIAETAGDQVRRVTPAGDISVVAGGGDPADGLGDGGPATSARLVEPSDVEVGEDGTLYISDTGNARVRRVGTDGVIRTVAGGGDPEQLGDDGPATQASLRRPRGIALAPDGTLYIADSGADRVRRATRDGRITTAAGGGTPADGLGDGGAAADAALDLPLDVAVDAEGTLYVADALHHRIRAVTAQGLISTVAGNGGAGASGDEGPATQAAIGTPQGIDVARDGTVYIADRPHHSVRRVSPAGVITRFAGTGTSGEDGNGGPPQQAELHSPHDVAVAPDGAVHIADAGNGRVRRASVALPGFTDVAFTVPAEDGSELYVFDRTGRHLRTVDPLTGAVVHDFTYDAAGRLTKLTDVDGNETTIERSPGGAPSAIVAPLGQRTALTLSAEGRIASITDPSGGVTALEYTPEGLLTEITDPALAVSTFEYDGFGRLAVDSDSAGGRQTLAPMDLAGGRRVTIATMLGRTSTIESRRLADGSIHLEAVGPTGAKTEADLTAGGAAVTKEPDGTVTRTSTAPDPRWGMLAPFLREQTETTPGGLARTIQGSRNVTLGSAGDPLSLTSQTDLLQSPAGDFSETYHASQRRLTTTSRGSTATTHLDARGRIVDQRLSTGLDPLTFTYDARGRPTQIAHGTETLAVEWDAAGRPAAYEDGAGRRLELTRDASGRPTTIAAPGASGVALGYDANGRVTAVTPQGASAPYAMTYDARGRLTSFDPPGGSAVETAFNADGQAFSHRFPGAQEVTTSYDSGGRSTGGTDPDGTTTLTYVGATGRRGTLIRALSGGATAGVERTYDGSLITRVEQTGAAPGRVEYSYDQAFRPKQVKVTSSVEPGATTVTTNRVYSSAGLLVTEGPYALDRSGAVGQPARITDGTISLEYSYDSAGRPIRRRLVNAGGTIASVDWTRDSGGRLATRTVAEGSAITTDSFAYDAAGRLTTVTRGGTPAEQYAYDTRDNRTSRTIGGGSAQVATYDGQDRLTAVGATTHTFDDAGFLTSRGADTFTYTRLGELREAHVGGETVTYAYDALGRRVARTDSGGTTRYIYGEPEDAGAVSAVRAPDGTVTVLRYDRNGLLHALEVGAQRYRVLTDQVGTPLVVVDASGTVVKSVRYDAWGVELSDSKPSFELPLDFAGGLADPVTGLLRMGMRDYDPAAGRFTARDPILFWGDQLNVYAYAGDDPVNVRDPTGLGDIDDMKSAGQSKAIDAAIDKMTVTKGDSKAERVASEVINKTAKAAAKGKDFADEAAAEAESAAEKMTAHEEYRTVNEKVVEEGKPAVEEYVNPVKKAFQDACKAIMGEDDEKDKQEKEKQEKAKKSDAKRQPDPAKRPNQVPGTSPVPRRPSMGDPYMVY